MSFLQDTGMQVISGGQTGVDLAALRAAQSLGFRTGGEAPKGWKTTAGPRPDLVHFELTEGKGGYHDRTVNNVVLSDATLIIAVKPDSSGTALTVKACIAHNKPYKVVTLDERPTNEAIQDIVAWVKANATAATLVNGGFILNVAGNSSRTVPGIFIPAFTLMLNVLMLLRDDDDTAADWEEVRSLFPQLQDSHILHQLHDNFERIDQLNPRHRRSQVDGEFEVTE